MHSELCLSTPAGLPWRQSLRGRCPATRFLRVVLTSGGGTEIATEKPLMHGFNNPVRRVAALWLQFRDIEVKIVSRWKR
jgi:hypothetical protein